MSNNIHGTVAAVKHEKFHLCHIDVYIAPFALQRYVAI